MPVEPKSITFFKLRSLYDLVLGLHPHASHSASSLLLWDILKETIECLMARLEPLDSRNTTEVDLIRRYGEIGDNLHSYLGFLEAGEANRIPSVIVSPLQDMMGSQAPDPQVVVWCSWLPSNYSVPPTLGMHLKKTVSDVFDDPKHRVVRQVPEVLAAVSFPAAERDNVLLHSALGHELGHVLVAYKHDIDKYQKKSKVRLEERYLIEASKMSDSTDDAAESGSGSLPLTDQTKYELLSGVALRVTINWLNELLSDAYSVYFLGPAPVLSLHYLRGINGPSVTHPPGCLRFPLMLECLRRSGFREASDPDLGWLAPRIAEIESACPDDPGYTDPVYRTVFSCLKSHQSSIAKYIMRLGRSRGAGTRKKAYTYSDWCSLYSAQPTSSGTRNALVDRILNYVIPDTIESDGNGAELANLPSILNSGWAVFYGYWDQFCSGLEASDLTGQHMARQKLFNLLLKAIEAVDLKRRWENSQ